MHGRRRLAAKWRCTHRRAWIAAGTSCTAHGATWQLSAPAWRCMVIQPRSHPLVAASIPEASPDALQRPPKLERSDTAQSLQVLVWTCLLCASRPRPPTPCCGEPLNTPRSAGGTVAGASGERSFEATLRCACACMQHGTACMQHVTACMQHVTACMHAPSGDRSPRAPDHTAGWHLSWGRGWCPPWLPLWLQAWPQVPTAARRKRPRTAQKR